ncbi:sulfurtransferase TusA family protein [Neiella marina]|uniref:Sulfurtransferase TusA family protein n=1 Tax=Neiella holothuriorum TaxID=2870530 RepID=A0ABS7EG88_9GAMM|nr:sulfurtransferase TusA family protein [Neiella holothuriorum]MBW8191359.1 sulfurtransferase TusA family protein [Neiella holothuriorum]
MNPIVFDAMHLVCPEFQIQMRRHLSKQPAGQLVHIITSAPNAVRDVRLYAAHSGHQVVAIEQTEARTDLMLLIGKSTG